MADSTSSPATLITVSILGSQIVKQVYEDAVSPTAKVVGKRLAEYTEKIILPVVDSFIGFSDRVENDLKKVCESVPEQHRTSVSPEVSGKVFERLRYMPDENEAKNLYLTLLASALDARKADKVHPRFLITLEHFSYVEAILFEKIHVMTTSSEWVSIHVSTMNSVLPTVQVPHGNEIQMTEFTRKDRDRIRLAMESMLELNLLDLLGHSRSGDDFNWWQVRLTPYGKKLADVCLPSISEPSLP